MLQLGDFVIYQRLRVGFRVAKGVLGDGEFGSLSGGDMD